MPKQFLELNGRPVLQHSLELLSQVQQVLVPAIQPDHTRFCVAHIVIRASLRTAGGASDRDQ